MSHRIAASENPEIIIPGETFDNGTSAGLGVKSISDSSLVEYI